MSKNSLTIKINKTQLVEYAKELLTKPGLAIDEFIKQQQPELKSKDIIADLSSINFDKNFKINLSNADLRGTILDNVEFNGNYVVLKGANLSGASMKGVKFTGTIDLAGTNLGNIVPTKQMFANCLLNDAIYKNKDSKLFMVQVTPSQVKKYLELRADGQKVAQGSLNDYVASIYRHKYFEDAVLVADLTGIKFDESFNLNNADFSGSNLQSTVFSNVDATNVSFRDALLWGASIENCKFTNADLRGVELDGHNEYNGDFFEAVKLNNTLFVNPSLSVSALDGSLNKAIQERIIPENFRYEGVVTCDPLYMIGSSKEEASKILPLKRATKADVIEHIEDSKKRKAEGREPLDFHKFYCLKNEIIGKKEQDFYIDLSGEDLSGLDLSGLNYQRTNFAYTNIVGTKFDNSILNGSNFGGANASGQRATSLWLFNIGSDISTSFKGAQLEKANLVHVKAEYADFTGANLKGANAPRLNGYNIVADSINATNANLARSGLRGVSSQDSTLVDGNFKGTDLAYANLKKSNAKGANLTDANMEGVNLEEADLSHANLTNANLRYANLKRTNLTSAKVAADITNAEANGVILKDADLSGLFYEEAPELDNVDVKAALTSTNAAKLEHERAMQAETRALEGKSAFRRYINKAIDFFAPKPLKEPLHYFMDTIFTVIDNHKLVAGLTIVGGILALGAAFALSTYLLPVAIASTVFTSLALPSLIAGCVAGFAASMKIADIKIGDLHKEVNKAYAEVEKLENAQSIQPKVEEGIIEEFAKKVGNTKSSEELQKGIGMNNTNTSNAEKYKRGTSPDDILSQREENKGKNLEL